MPTGKYKKNEIPLVTNYNSFAPNIGNILKKLWNIIEQNWVSEEIFPQKPMVSYRRDRNIIELLKNKLKGKDNE